MRAKYFIVLILASCAVRGAYAGGSVGMPTVTQPLGTFVPNPYGNPYGKPLGNQYSNPLYGGPYTNPYGNPYANPYYANPYANPYGNPYGTSPYYGYGNGVPGGYYPRLPVYGAPQLINGNFYNFNVGGGTMSLWRAPSGYYYPWMGGYNYTQYPIYIYNGTSSTPTESQPPLSTVFSDLNEYLDQAKKSGKIDENQYKHLKQRASDLIVKENSQAYENGGTADPSQESDMRRDVEGLSAEVARAVRP
jgi:hypothetical protein